MRNMCREVGCRRAMGLWILALFCIGQFTTFEARPYPLGDEFESGLSSTSRRTTRSLKYLVTTPQTVLTYHNGPVLSGASIPVYVLWYGSFTDTQKGIIRDFFGSFGQGASSANFPTVTSWWGMTAGYVDSKGAGVSQNVNLAGELDDSGASLGTSITEEQVQTLLLNAFTAKTLPTDGNAVYFVLTDETILVEGFCEICGSHNALKPSTISNGQDVLYAWVGNSATQCPGQCAWPFAKAPYGPGLQLVSPNGDVGIDGMIINIASLFAGAATDPLGSGWYQGQADSPLESGTACTGIYGDGAFPGDPGKLYLAPGTNASFNAVGVNSRDFVLPALWLPANSTCTPPPLS